MTTIESRDPVTTYARRVRDGKIVAGRAVRQACARHLRDLARQDTAAFPYAFDPVAAKRVIDFFPTFLTLEDGSPFVLPPWLQFCYGAIYGWLCASGERAGLRRFQYGFFETSKGSGKALALDTPIPTPTGWTTMGELHVGDHVFDDAGRPTTVVAVSDVMRDHPCYEVVFDDGATIIADEDHLWQTEMRAAMRADGKLASVGVPIHERGAWKHGLRTTAEIARTLRYPNGKYQSANHSVALAGPLGTPAVELPIQPYVLGVWLGDGDSDCARVTIGDQDTELVEHLEAAGVTVGARSATGPHAGRYRVGGRATETCGRGHDPSEQRVSDGKCRACEREIDSAHRAGRAPSPRTVLSLNEHLRISGLLLNKHIPDAYLRAAVEQRLAMLQGLMDTDGYISPKSGECSFYSTNRDLAIGVQELVVSLGVKCTFRERAATLYGREVSRLWIVQFHPPYDMPVFRLRRKLQWQRQRHTRRRLSGERRIEAVRPVPSVPVRCIAVDSPSHLYLAGRSMIPTHNTPSGGGIGLYGMAFDGEEYGEIYSAAFDKGQASIILNDAIRMATHSPDLSKILTIDKYNIAHEASGSFMRAVSSEHRGKSGPRPYYVLADEIHEHRDGRVINKLLAGFKGRLQPLALFYTNSGSDKTSVCWEYHQKSLAVLDGVLEDEQWFAYVCHLDPCEACYADGYRQPRDGCAACDDWTDPAVWPKVAPALGIVIQPKYLQDAVDAARSIPSEYAMKRRLNFCIWTETHTVWIAPDAWQACQRETVSDHNDGRACAVGFDMAEKIDLTAGVVALRVDDEQERAEDTVELVDMVGDQEVRKTLNLNFSVELIPYFWIPEDTLRQRVTAERIPYDAWHRQGHVRVTPGPVIDHDLVYEQFVTDIGKRYRPQRVGYDAHNATQFAVALRDKAKYTIVDVPQGRALSESFKLFEALVLLKRIRHAGNPVLGFCVANAEPKRDRYQNLWIEKPSQTKRIDGLIAAVIALSQLVLLPAKARPKRRAPLIYTTSGFVPAVTEETHAPAR